MEVEMEKEMEMESEMEKLGLGKAYTGNEVILITRDCKHRQLTL